MTQVYTYEINTDEDIIKVAGETKEEAEGYAEMAGFTITAPTTQAYYYERQMVTPAEIMPHSGDIIPAAYEMVKVTITV